MAREDVTDSNIGPCPCGRGHIVHRHTGQSHGWGAGSSESFIDCESCAAEWRYDYGTFINIPSEQLFWSLRKEEELLKDELRPLGMDAIRLYFEGTDLRHMTKELAELKRLGIGYGTIEDYRKERRTKSMADIADPVAQPDFVATNCEEEDRPRAKEIADRLRILPAEIRKAERRIIKHRVPPRTA